MPLFPSSLERLFLRSRPQLKAFLDIWGTGAFEAVLQASQLGLFDAVREGASTPQEIARRIKTDVRATVVLLDMLEAFGYLRKKDGRYRLTGVAEGFYKDPTMVSQDVVRLYGQLFRFWRENEDAAVRTGEPQVNAFKWFDENPEVWTLFQSFERGIAKEIGPKVAAMARLPASAKRMIDVGGGHGMYSVMFCRRYPQLTAAVFDSAKPLSEARALIESEKMGGRMAVREGDFLKDDLGDGYDVAFLSNIIHLFTLEVDAALLRRVAASLNPGGRIVILDQTKGGEFGPVSKGGHAFYGLIFLIATGGQLYTYAEVSGLLKNAGFTDVRRKTIRTAGNDVIVAAKAK